jgi:hypothetical protein
MRHEKLLDHRKKRRLLKVETTVLTKQAQKDIPKLANKL